MLRDGRLILMADPATPATIGERLATICDPVRECPLCGSTRYAAESRHQPNRYSEELSILVGIPQADLLETLLHLRCADCGAGFKNWWYKPTFYSRLFLEAVPVHPQGWDSVSGRFTAPSFVREVEGLERALLARDDREINKQRRTVQSYLDNIPRARLGSSGTSLTVSRARAIDLDHMTAVDRDFLLDEVAPLIHTPKTFGRFAGYGGEAVGRFIADHVPRLGRYGEVGCPLWGMIPWYARRPGVATVHFRDEEGVFWGPGCARAGRTCGALASEQYAATPATLSEAIAAGTRVDLLSVIHYVDHLRAPGEFLRRATCVADHLLLICHQDIPKHRGVVQHHVVFNRPALERMGERLGLEVADVLPCPPDSNDEELVILLRTRRARAA
jgi:hypothetical protein